MTMIFTLWVVASLSAGNAICAGSVSSGLPAAEAFELSFANGLQQAKLQ